MSSTSAGCTSAYLKSLGLAQVKKVAPKLRLDAAKTKCDLDTLQAVISHRYEVLAKYAQSLKHTLAKEIDHLKDAPRLGVDRSTLKRWVLADSRTLQEDERAKLNLVLSKTTNAGQGLQDARGTDGGMAALDHVQG